MPAPRAALSAALRAALRAALMASLVASSVLSLASCRTPLWDPADADPSTDLFGAAVDRLAIDGVPGACPPRDDCHLAGRLDPGTGSCVWPTASDGSPCDDRDSCTGSDACSAGTCRGLSRGASSGGCLRWRTGWDVGTAPINVSESYAAWTIDPVARSVAIDLFIAGGRPGAAYVTGMHYFPVPPVCLGSFGQASDHGSCIIPAMRSGITVPGAEVFDLGSMSFDGTGRGRFSYLFKGVPPGRYPIEFHVRVGDYGQVVGGHTCPNCDVHYQAPGPFGGTVALVMPP